MNAAVATTCGCLLFDMDGVLVDSNGAIEKSWATWAAKHALDEAEVMRNIHGRKAIEVIRHFLPEGDHRAEWDDLIAMESRFNEHVVPFDGARELLTALTAAPWGIVTSAPRKLAEERIARIGGDVTPKTLVCAEDVTEGKPSPAPFLLAAQQLGVAADACVVVEDSDSGIASGKAAGMRVIAINNAPAPADWHIPHISDITVTSLPLPHIALRIGR